jgi:hypothetical protein
MQNKKLHKRGQTEQYKNTEHAKQKAERTNQDNKHKMNT